MDVLQAIFLALIQGLTEFLPISSSAHLILPSQLLGWPDQGLAFDVAVHVGSLLAVVIYFRRDIVSLTHGWCRSFVSGPSPESRLGWFIIVATVPAGLAGLMFDDFIEEQLRSSLVIALTTIVFGLALGVADLKGNKLREISDMTLRAALIIGVAQAIALIPGTSRSGITMTAALLLGFQRQSAAQFSFLMSIPVITLSGGYKGLELLQAESVDWQPVVMGTVMSFVSALATIYLFLRWIDRIGMWPFVGYRLLLGAVLLALVWA